MRDCRVSGLARWIIEQNKGADLRQEKPLMVSFLNGVASDRFLDPLPHVNAPVPASRFGQLPPPSQFGRHIGMASNGLLLTTVTAKSQK